MKHLIGLDIGGTKCAVQLGQYSIRKDIELIDKLIYKTSEKPAPSLMLPQLLSGIEKLLDAHNLRNEDIAAIGISCGGPLDSKKGIILSPPNLPGWDKVYIVKYFMDHLSVPVFLQNDANACALAEWKFGAGKGTGNMVFLTFGTGLGAGLILNGRLYEGTNDNAGEVGHIRLDNFGPVGYGKSGSFEGFCSGSGLAQLAHSKILEKFQMGEKVTFCENISEIEHITAKNIAEAADKGDPLALEIFEICGNYLGRGLAIIIDILNPECIVLGSIFVRAGKFLINAMKKSLGTEALPLSHNVCRIVPAALDEQVGDIAALSVAVNNINDF